VCVVEWLKLCGERFISSRDEDDDDDAGLGGSRDTTSITTNVPTRRVNLVSPLDSLTRSIAAAE